LNPLATILKKEPSNEKLLSDSIAQAAYGGSGGYNKYCGVSEWSSNYFVDVEPSSMAVTNYNYKPQEVYQQPPSGPFSILFECREKFEINKFGIICTSSFEVHATASSKEISILSNKHTYLPPPNYDEIREGEDDEENQNQNINSSATTTNPSSDNNMANQALLKTNYIYVWPTAGTCQIDSVIACQGAKVLIKCKLATIASVVVRGSGEIHLMGATDHLTYLKCLASGTGFINGEFGTVCALVADAQHQGEISGFHVLRKASLFPRDVNTFIGITGDDHCVIQRKTGTPGKVSACRKSGRGPVRPAKRCRK
jgi:hypothetical protein